MPAGLRRRLERWGRHSTQFERWWIESVVEVGREAGASAEIVYASMSPFETAEAAARLGSILGVPWVADLRDPWALDEMTVYPTRLHRALERRRMRRALVSAAAVVMNTPEATRVTAESFPELADRLTHSIPNGYDAPDFAGPTGTRADSSFRIVHTGYLHAALGFRYHELGRLRRLIGGQTPGVNFLTRSHVYLLEAVTALLDRRPDLVAKVEIVLAGVLTDVDVDIVKRFPHRERVRMPGYLPHHDSVELIRTADLLFLPMHDLPPGRRATIVPGKTFEYLASGRPIVAAVPDGDARDLLGHFDHVTLCRPTDTQAIAEAIEATLVATGLDRSSAAPLGAERFERRSQTEALARVFDAVLAG